MIQVEALEQIKSDGFIIATGDRITLPEDVAKRWCGSGWAQAVNGEVKTGERRVLKSVVQPLTANQSNSADEVKTNG